MYVMNPSCREFLNWVYSGDLDACLGGKWTQNYRWIGEDWTSMKMKKIMVSE